ncbi:hypothetical protein HMPREF9010_00306 [Bacteroides sp. 3_1_23]|nr:hypothetical protein HMPREF9010_00306 [Bacteroides sp. 3_1_23]
MLWMKLLSKIGHHGGSLRLPEYAYEVRMSAANLCDIGTSCKTPHENIGSIAISNMMMLGYPQKYPYWILPLPQTVKKQK